MKDSGKSAFEEYEDGALIREGTDAWLLAPRKNVKVLEVKNVDELESLPERTDERVYIDETYIDFEEFFGLGYDGINTIVSPSYSRTAISTIGSSYSG